MSRLTEYGIHKGDKGIWVKEEGDSKTFFAFYDEGYKAIEKLAHYEDLEEQGRLIEVRCGEWAKRSNDEIWWYECSRCSGPILKNGWGNDMFSEFCPNCGAKMELKELEGDKE